VEKSDARMRQRARIFRAIARNRRAARMRIDALNVFIDIVDAFRMRVSLAYNARRTSSMRLRWSTWPTPRMHVLQFARRASDARSS